MTRRILALHLPSLPTDRLRRVMPDLPDGEPLATWCAIGSRRVLAAVDAVAAGLGLGPGQALADAQAILPGLLLHHEDQAADAALLLELALWARRYSPLTATDAPDGLLFDITGCDHLFGGEAAILADVLARLRRAGIAARGAVAGAAATAAALARCRADSPVIAAGDEAAAVGRLPIEAALQCSDAQLARLGLRRVGELLALPRAALARRFGKALLARLDEVASLRPSSLQPIQPPPNLAVAADLAEPIITRAAIDSVLDGLLADLCTGLRSAGRGVRRLDLLAWRVDGVVQRVTIGTSKPSRTAAHLALLFRDRLQGLEPGLGFERMALEVPVADLMPDGVQRALAIGARRDADDSLAELIDRLAQRVRVRRLAPAASHWPERMVKRIGPHAAMPPMPPGWGGQRAPALLLRRAELVAVLSRTPEGAPTSLHWRGTTHPILRAEGPRRVEAEWWRGNAACRDYWCIAIAGGAGLWLYREGPPQEPRWHLQGYLP